MPKSNSDNDYSDDDSESEDAKKRIHDVMKTFDEDGDELLEPLEVAACLRVLGFAPSNVELELPKTNELYSFEVVLNRVLTASANGDWPRDPDVTIEKAFEVIASGGILSRDVLLNYLCTIGEPLSNSEVKQLLSHLTIRKNGQVDWKTYIKDAVKFIEDIE